MKFPHLFAPGKIGNMSLKNRLVMPPMVRNYASKQGEVTNRYLDHIESIAAGDVGMMILEASFISPEGKGFVNELGINNEKLIPGLKKLVKVAHAHGAKIGPQLYHAGRQTHHNVTGQTPVAPSAIPCPVMQDKPEALKTNEIYELENKFAESARLAKEAGMDFVEIHGAHGYLITQFLSPFSNKRKDKYGGSLTNRMRFLTHIILKVRAVVGDEFPVIVRLSADEMVDKGIKLNDSIKICQKLADLDVDALHISSGNYASYAKGYLISPMAIPEAPLVKYAAAIKKKVNIPIITVDQIHQPKTAEKILKNNQADFIGIGRGLLADPQWPQKAKTNKLNDINYCISCNQGCITRLFAQQDVQCTVNPMCGFEKELAYQKTKRPKNVTIIGGGPAGLYAANLLHNIGHKVTLFEKDKKLGGLLNQAEKPPHRWGITVLKNHLIDKAKKPGIKIIHKEADEKNVAKTKPDYVIYAAGSTAIRPVITGINYPNVQLADDIFTKQPKLKKKVIVAGGGCQGAQIADMLSAKKHNVTLIELSENIALEMPIAEKALLMERLIKQKVKIHTKTKIVKIDEEGAIIKKGKGKTKLKSDHIIICFGRKPNQDLLKKLKKKFKVINIGDSKQVRRINEALREAHEACLTIK